MLSVDDKNEIESCIRLNMIYETREIMVDGIILDLDAAGFDIVKRSDDNAED